MFLIFAAISGLGIAYYALLVPESPQWHHDRKEYQEARACLGWVAAFNGRDKVDGLPYHRFRFYKEQEELGVDERHSCSQDEADQLQAIADQQLANQASSIAEAQYCMNIFKMSVLWTAGTFGTYLLSYLNKYLPGTIFLNTYFDGIAGLIAYSVGKDIYTYFKLKASFISSLSLSFVFTIFLYLLRIEAIAPNWIMALGSPPSEFEPGSPEDNEFHLQK